ncbi:hypothetical protein CEV31_1095 [Brucella thiophenivorans]|uniref:Uncharacterized protein n=1 Tax=Brucella thiophenivorans TaxID=571255 RepID=A0A256FXV6_9HYPH|nr:hypothetical protein CEV31_1095 [Brucella thiophenivorans]
MIYKFGRKLKKPLDEVEGFLVFVQNATAAWLSGHVRSL